MKSRLRTTKIDCILYSVDSPLEHNADRLWFMMILRENSLVSDEDFEKVAYENIITLPRVA